MKEGGIMLSGNQTDRWSFLQPVKEYANWENNMQINTDRLGPHFFSYDWMVNMFDQSIVIMVSVYKISQSEIPF